DDVGNAAVSRAIACFRRPAVLVTTLVHRVGLTRTGQSFTGQAEYLCYKFPRFIEDQRVRAKILLVVSRDANVGPNAPGRPAIKSDAIDAMGQINATGVAVSMDVGEQDVEASVEESRVD